MKYKYYSIDRDYGNRRVTKRRQRGEREGGRWKLILETVVRGLIYDLSRRKLCFCHAYL